MRRHVLRDVKASAVLPMERTRGKNDQLSAVQPSSHFIELREASADTLDALRRIQKRVDATGKRRDDIRRRNQLLAGARFPQFQQRFLGVG